MAQGVDECQRAQQTDLLIAANDPAEHDLQYRTRKTELLELPDVVPSVARQAMLASPRGIANNLPNQSGN